MSEFEAVEIETDSDKKICVEYDKENGVQMEVSLNDSDQSLWCPLTHRQVSDLILALQKADYFARNGETIEEAGRRANSA